MAAKLLNLLAISSLAIIGCTFGPPTVTALSIESSHHIARHSTGHEILAKKKRGTSSKRCKPRPSSSAAAAAAPTSTPSAAPSSAPAPPPPPPQSSSPAPKPSQTSQPAQSSGGSGSSAGSSSGGSGGGGKVGLAWNDPQPNDLFNFKSPNANTVYTWSCFAPPTAADAGMVFAPMMWGPKQIGDCDQQLPNLPPTVLLGPNEPDEPSQSNLSPQDAAQFWMDNIQKWKQKGFRLGSPAPTGSDRGFQWMKDFLGACQGCTIDFIAFHYYGTNAQQMIDFLTKVHDTFGMNIWVTEFADQDFGGGPQATLDQAFDFMGKVKSFMDNTPWIERYFAFGALPDLFNVNPVNALMDPNSRQPTSLGHFYLGN